MFIKDEIKYYQSKVWSRIRTEILHEREKSNFKYSVGENLCECNSRI